MMSPRIFSAFVLGLCAIAAAPAVAHPGVGIAMDGRGNVFYTDLQRVWCIAPDGSKSVVVPGVHTHELHVDARGVLFGEHLWYEGERTDRWGHRVWARALDGRITDVVAARRGFLADHGDSLVRNAAGAMFWVDRKAGHVFKRRAPDGTVADVGRCNDCRDVRWLTVGPDDTVYFADRHALRAMAPGGQARTLVPSLVGGGRQQPDLDRHAVMGLWTDRAGHVYAAVAGEGVVKRVGQDGRIATVFESSPGWRPSGGLTAPNGDLWVLEFNPLNEVRVTRLSADGRRTVF